MINDSRAKADEMVQAAIDQSERLNSELNSAVDLLASGQVAFNTEMTAVAKLRADADKRQANAMRAFDTVCTQFTSIIVGLRSQISAGKIVTGGNDFEQLEAPQEPANDDRPADPVTPPAAATA